MEKVPTALPTSHEIFVAVGDALDRQHEHDTVGNDRLNDWTSTHHEDQPNPYEHPMNLPLQHSHGGVLPPAFMYDPNKALKDYTPGGTVYHDPAQAQTSIPVYRAGAPRHRTSAPGDYHFVDSNTGAPLPDFKPDPSKKLRGQEKDIAGALRAAPALGKRALVAARVIAEAQAGSSDSSHPLAPKPETRRERRLAQKLDRLYSQGPRGQAKAMRTYTGLTDRWAKRVERHNRRAARADRTLNDLRAKGKLQNI